MSAPSGKTAPTPSNAWPTETFYTLDHDLYFNGEGIQMFHQPNAVTDGDTIVHFRRSDVISAGDGKRAVLAPVYWVICSSSWIACIADHIIAGWVSSAC